MYQVTTYVGLGDDGLRTGADGYDLAMMGLKQESSGFETMGSTQVQTATIWRRRVLGKCRRVSRRRISGGLAQV